MVYRVVLAAVLLGECAELVKVDDLSGAHAAQDCACCAADAAGGWRQQRRGRETDVVAVHLEILEYTPDRLVLHPVTRSGCERDPALRFRWFPSLAMAAL